MIKPLPNHDILLNLVQKLLIIPYLFDSTLHMYLRRIFLSTMTAVVSIFILQIDVASFFHWSTFNASQVVRFTTKN